MKTIVVFVLITITTLTSHLATQQNGLPYPYAAETSPISQNIFSSDQTKTTKWEVSEKIILSIVVKRLTKGCDKNLGFDSCDELTVLDGRGKKLFNLQDSGIFISKFLTSNQVIIETNGGGTDDFLTILEYRNGKIVEIIASEETQMRGGYWIMPEYRTGNTGAYFKPMQICIIQQIGGADPNPNASVFRYREEFYKKVGEIKMNKLGDFIEAEIANNKKN